MGVIRASRQPAAMIVNVRAVRERRAASEFFPLAACNGAAAMVSPVWQTKGTSAIPRFMARYFDVGQPRAFQVFTEAYPALAK
ncbi:hypothetical protein CO650_22050 [Rhizobium phaseoli]|nr:hypothetical protein CO650_22050 [Rhizobium phaseoli]